MAVGVKLMGAESHWLMGRVMPRDFLKRVGEYLDDAAPKRKKEILDAIRARAKELADADKDMPIDGPSKGALAISAVVLASYENLLPLFDGDERRTILYLQHVMGTVLKRPYEVTFSTLSKRDKPLDKIEKVCGKTMGLYGKGWDYDFERPDPGTFEMNISHCFFRDFFDRHDNRLVTTVMCAFDVNFLEAIDPSVSGLRTERTSLMSLGDDHCRFAVLETDDPLATVNDKLNERFVDGKSR
jgi:hypothetical protein